jgi:hypothetical protein
MQEVTNKKFCLKGHKEDGVVDLSFVALTAGSNNDEPKSIESYS